MTADPDRRRRFRLVLQEARVRGVSEADIQTVLRVAREERLDPDEMRSALRPYFRPIEVAEKHEQARWNPDTIVAAIRHWAQKYGRPPSATDWAPSLISWDPEQRERRRKRYESEDCPPTPTVQRVMGSWAAAIEAAGFERPMTGRYAVIFVLALATGRFLSLNTRAEESQLDRIREGWGEVGDVESFTWPEDLARAPGLDHRGRRAA